MTAQPTGPSALAQFTASECERLKKVNADGYALAIAVAAHFKDTDAPLGKMAREFLAKAQS